MNIINIRGKTYTECITLKVSPEEKDFLTDKLCQKKTDKLSRKVREYLIKSLKGEFDPVYEYSIKQTNDKKMAVTVWENGQERDGLLYDNIDEAMRYVRSIDAKKRR